MEPYIKADSTDGENLPDKGLRSASGSASASDPMIGITIENRFKIISLLGEGGGAKVYKAQHLLLEKTVALKILHERKIDDEREQQRFKKEANLLSTIQDPNIVGFLGYGYTSEGKPYIATEFLEGISLEQLLKEERTLNCQDAIAIFLELSRGLQAIHSHGIIHRDIKPANIILSGSDSEQRKIKFIDFGIFLDSAGQNQRLTQTGQLLGSSNYMSPEQCRAAKDLDARSDIYSLACVIYECVAGAPPMQAESDLLIMQNHLNKKIESIRAVKGISNELESILLKCLSKERSARFQSAEELQSALMEAQKKTYSNKNISAKKMGIILSIFLFALGLVSSIFFLEKKSAAIKQAPPLQKSLVPPLDNIEEADKWLRKNAGDESIPLDTLIKFYCDLKTAHVTSSVPDPPAREVYSTLCSRLRLLKTKKLMAKSQKLGLLFRLGNLQAANQQHKELQETQNEIEADTWKPVDSSVKESEYHNALQGWSVIALNCADYSTALSLANTAKKLMEKRGDLSQKIMANCLRIKTQIQLGQFPAAIATAESTLQDTRTIVPRGQFSLHWFIASIDTIRQLVDARKIVEIAEQNLTGDDETLALRFLDLKECKNSIEKKQSVLRAKIALVKAERFAGKREVARGMFKRELERRMLESYKLEKELDISGNEQAFVAELIELDEEGDLLNAFLQKAKRISPDRYFTCIIKCTQYFLANNNPSRSKPSPTSKLTPTYQQVFQQNQIEAMNRGTQRIEQLTCSALAESEKTAPDVSAILKLQLAELLSAREQYKEAFELVKSALLQLKSTRTLKEKDELLAQASNSLMQIALSEKNIQLADSIRTDIENDNLLARASAPSRFTFDYLKGRIFFKLPGRKQEGLSIHRVLQQRYKHQSIRVLHSYSSFAKCFAEEMVEAGKLHEAEDILKRSVEALYQYRITDTAEMLKLLEQLEEYCKTDPDSVLRDPLLSWLGKEKSAVLDAQIYFSPRPTIFTLAQRMNTRQKQIID